MTPTRSSLRFLLPQKMTIKFNREFYNHYRNARVRSRGRLPHVEADGALYSITYRLADALPRQRVVELRRERATLLSYVDREGASSLERSSLLQALGQRYDESLDRGYGSCLLKRAELAEIVAENLQFHNGRDYELGRWCVMPNHVHVAMLLYRGADLQKILHGWKSYTAHEINRLLGRSGALWEKEYWDRLIRDEQDFNETSRYIFENPIRAGLTGWKWRG